VRDHQCWSKASGSEPSWAIRCIHHTAEHPSAYGAFGSGGEGWLVVSQASRCLVPVHGPFATRAAARAEVRRIKIQAEERAEARRHAAR
jgi:hypothetical protein